ncbi:transmembrane protease serine 6-like isoform X2 [Narcine bancroftii]
MKSAQGRKTPRDKRSQQSVKENAAKRKCSRCGYKCLPIISGFILLVLIAGSITLIRGVLEVPMIINGFAPKRPATTSATIILDSTASNTSQTHTFSTSGTKVENPTNTTSDSGDKSPDDKCYFVGEMAIKETISIRLSDLTSEEYLRIVEEVEKMIYTTYKRSIFSPVYITTKLIRLSPVHSALRFWMHLKCSVRFQEKEISRVLQIEEGTVNLSDDQQLKFQLNSTIIWCKNNMLRCTSGYCINKTDGYCDGSEDCWDGGDEANCGSHSTIQTTEQQCLAGKMVCPDGNCVNKYNGFCDGVPDCSDGSDEWNCDCEVPLDTACSSVVILTGMKYKNPCQGSLISSRWVLTTESCADDSSFQYICAGSPNLTKYTIQSRHTLDSKDDGIALLLLDTPVSFTYFQPIPLPDPANETETNQTSCKVTGLQDMLRQGEWHVTASDKQQIVIREDFPNLRNCQVQKGSPLVCLKANDTWVLTAVRGGCSQRKNSFSRINHVLSEIKANMDTLPPNVDN